MKTMKILKLRVMGRLASRFPCLAWRWGIVGIMSAPLTEGPDKGMPLGIALAITKIRAE